MHNGAALRRGTGVIVLALVLAVGGCGTKATPGSVGSPSVSPSLSLAASVPGPSPTATPPGPGPAPVATTPPAKSPAPSPTAASTAAGFTDANKGQTVNVRVGQQFTVSLSSTYWEFQPLPDSTVLRSVGAPVTRPSPGCVPGGGCGTVSASYMAAGAGRVTIVATRRSCGEAMLCTGSAGQFALTVVVTP
jgi:hypothetical protein